MGCVRAMVVGEDDPAPKACPGLRSGFPGVQTGAFLRQGPPRAPDEPKVRDANMLSKDRPFGRTRAANAASWFLRSGIFRSPLRRDRQMSDRRFCHCPGLGEEGAQQA